MYISINTVNTNVHDKEKLFSTISVLQTNSFKIDLPKSEPAYGEQVFS